MKITFLIGHMVKERDLILYELAEDLGKHGAQVTIISGYPSRRISDEVREYYLNHPIEKINENVLSMRVGSKKGEGNGLFIRMLKYVSLSKAIIKKALSIETDVYYIYSTPPFLGYHINKLRKKAPVLYNAQDLFPDSLINALHISEKNPLIYILRKFEKNIYNKSDSIVTISKDMKKHILKYGGEDSKVHVINNWADTDKIQPIKKENNSLYKEFKINKDKFTIVYAGEIGIHQRLDLFLKVAKKLSNITNNIQFVFFGNGVYVNKMKETIAMENLNNFYVFPLQPVDKISEVYSLGDIDIVSLEKGMTELALPSKIWSIMSVGRPMLALLDSNSDIAHTIDGKLGYVIDEMSVDEICETIIKCANNKDTLVEMGLSARNIVTVENNRMKQTKKYYKELESIMEKNENTTH